MADGTYQNMLKDGRKENEMKSYWLKKQITKKEWDTLKQNGAYCYLEDGRVAFLGRTFDDQIPNGCCELNDEELRRVNAYREANHIYPLPLSENK